MDFRRPLAILLSTILAAQPAVVSAARHAPGPVRDPAHVPALQPVFNFLEAGGYRDKAIEQDLEAALAAIVRSLPPETVQQMQEVAELITSNPTDEATLRAAREKFEESVAALPPETQQRIRLFASGASYLAGLAFAVLAIIKFEQHKDNPTQIPIGTPIALLIVASAMLFLPNAADGAAQGCVAGGSQPDISPDLAACQAACLLHETCANGSCEVP